MAGCPLPRPRRAASSAVLEVAAGRITLFTPHRVGGALVSVALTTGCPAPTCVGHPALRCLDFPLTRGGRAADLPPAVPTRNYTRRPGYPDAARPRPARPRARTSPTAGARRRA